jgi:hypothetical protein
MVAMARLSARPDSESEIDEAFPGRMEGLGIAVEEGFVGPGVTVGA